MAIRIHGLTHFPNIWFQPENTILIGMSMGGYLAPRAAAFDPRITGVVAYDVLFDMGSIADRYAAAAQTSDGAKNPDIIWAIDNARWTLGAETTEQAIQLLRSYNPEGCFRKDCSRCPDFCRGM